MGAIGLLTPSYCGLGVMSDHSGLSEYIGDSESSSPITEGIVALEEVKVQRGRRQVAGEHDEGLL